MTPLLILFVLLVAVWVFAIWGQHHRAAFMRPWMHVPLLAALVVLALALVAALSPRT